MRISDWSSDVCSSDLQIAAKRPRWRSGLWVVLCLLINQDCLLPSAWRLVGAVNATRPAARSFLSLKQFVTSPFNAALRSEEHTSELQSLMRISYAVFCLKKKNKHKM